MNRLNEENNVGNYWFFFNTLYQKMLITKHANEKLVIVEQKEMCFVVRLKGVL